MFGQLRVRSQVHLAALLFATCTVTLLQPAAVAAGSDSVEYAVKAAYLYKLGDFVEWPASTFPTPTSAVNLCVAGADPFGVSLDVVAAGRHIGARPIVVRHLASVTPESDCQILFVGGSDPQIIGRILDAVRGVGVLTVTDALAAGETPSIIRFVIHDDHVRMVIDGRAASLNGIIISSKLLSVALSVIPAANGSR
jgi:YfiR/HmsC-like